MIDQKALQRARSLPTNPVREFIHALIVGCATFPSRQRPPRYIRDTISVVDIDIRHSSLCLGSLNRAYESAYFGELCCPNTI